MNTRGISPVIGVILLVGVTVGFTALAGVFVFDITETSGGVDSTADISTAVSKNETHVTVKVLRAKATYLSLRVTGDSSINKTIDSASAGDSVSMAYTAGESVAVVTGDGSSQRVTQSLSLQPQKVSTEKFTPEWSRTAGESGNDIVADGVYHDDSFYIVGWNKTPNSIEFLTIKYSTNGTEIWRQEFDSGNGADRALGVAADTTGVYVTGRAHLPTRDFYTIKYSHSGNEIWNTSYDKNSQFDSANSVSVGPTGVYVMGESKDSGRTDEDYQLLKYTKDDGSLVWGERYDSDIDSSTQSRDKGYGVSATEAGVFVTGYTNQGDGDFDHYTIKYNMDGEKVWSDLYTVTQKRDTTHELYATENGNVYIAGDASISGDEDHFVYKYTSTGQRKWTDSLDGGGEGGALDITTDKYGNVYTIGYVTTNGDVDYVISEYSPSGDILTQDRYNVSGDTYGAGIGVESQTQIYAGLYSDASGDYKFNTTKYSR